MLQSLLSDFDQLLLGFFSVLPASQVVLVSPLQADHCVGNPDDQHQSRDNSILDLDLIPTVDVTQDAEVYGS